MKISAEESAKVVDYINFLQQKLSYLAVIAELLSKSNGLNANQTSSVGGMLMELVDGIRTRVDKRWQEWRCTILMN